MCELLAKMADLNEVLVAVAFVIGALLEYFPVLGQWEMWKKALLDAGIGLILPLGAFFIGVAQACWAMTWGSAEPFVLAGLMAAIAALGGNLTVKGVRAARAK